MVFINILSLIFYIVAVFYTIHLYQKGRFENGGFGITIFMLIFFGALIIYFILLGNGVIKL